MAPPQRIEGDHGFSGIAAVPVTMQRPVPEVRASGVNRDGQSFIFNC